QARCIKIESRIDEGQWQIDSARMVRVIVNLLSNAIKFSSENSSINVVALADAGMVTVSVQDAGRGIPGDALKDLFEPFKQTRSADGARGKGTGLGLYICQKIAEAHGGKISVQSEEMKGSTFTIQIPDSPVRELVPGIELRPEAGSELGSRSES